MSYSEDILNELMKIASTSKVGLFEAAADYCEQHDIDPEEFIASLDKVIIDRLRSDAVAQRKVRRCVQPPMATLF